MNFWTICISLIVASLVAIVFGYAMVGYAIIGLLAAALLLFYRVAIFKFVGEVKVELDLRKMEEPGGYVDCFDLLCARGHEH